MRLSCHRRFCFEPCLPVLTATLDKLDQWYDRNPKRRKLRREWVVAIYVLISFAFGLLMTTRAGFYIFNIFDSYVCGAVPLLIICITQLVTVLFAYRTTFASWFERFPPRQWPGQTFITQIRYYCNQADLNPRLFSRFQPSVETSFDAYLALLGFNCSDLVSGYVDHCSSNDQLDFVRKFCLSRIIPNHRLSLDIDCAMQYPSVFYLLSSERKPMRRRRRVKRSLIGT